MIIHITYISTLNVFSNKYMLKQFHRKMHVQYIKMRWGSGENYAYLLSDSKTRHSWVIDPAEPHEVLPYLTSNIELKAIVNTHHHYDHSGGNSKFHEEYKSLPIIAGKDSPLVTKTPFDGEVLKLGDDIEITAIHTPCHTQDSICYYAHDKATGEKAVFTGDTLFTAGCGRFFEGTPEEMDVALNEKLAALPKNTKVYPGHEYTKSNIRFAETVVQNQAMIELKEFATKNEITTGIFTIGDELSFNPFMRLKDPQIQSKLNLTDRTLIMAKLRELKNKS